MLVLAMIHAAPISTTAAPGVPVGGPFAGDTCQDSDSSSGMGGQSLSCEIACGAGSGLAAEITASDVDATSSVSIGCGGGGGAVSCPTYSCAVTGQPATEAQADGSCAGSTNEFWDSGASLACASTAGYTGDIDPHDLICRKVPEFPTCEDIEDVCLRTNSWGNGLPEDVLAALFPEQFKEHVLLAMTTATAFGEELLAAAFYQNTDDEDGECKMRLYEREEQPDGSHELVEVDDPLVVLHDLA